MARQKVRATRSRLFTEDADAAIALQQAKRPKGKAAKSEPTAPPMPQLPPLEAKTENQRAYLRSMERNAQTVVFGPAGTGKTYLAMRHAADLFMDGKIDKIILTRPNVPSGPQLGFRPGDQNAKMADWVVPMMEVLHHALGGHAVTNALKTKLIEIAPFETMRGRSFTNAFILLDEAQNTSLGEIKMFLTRMGANCKVVLNGDVSQHDLKGQSGLAVALDLLNRDPDPEIGIVGFTMDDIVRSGITGRWVRRFWAHEHPEPKVEPAPEPTPEEVLAGMDMMQIVKPLLSRNPFRLSGEDKA